MNYYAVLTDHGAQLIEQAYQHGQVVTITQMAIGDGGGVELEPETSALAVAGEFDRVPLTSGASASSMLGGGVDYESQAHVGKWIRTLGLMDAQGNLIVYSNYPPTYIADKGSTLFRTLGLNIQLPIVHGDAVTVIVERPPYPPATHEALGVVRFATEAEAISGLLDAVAVAPKEMKSAIEALLDIVAPIGELRIWTLPTLPNDRFVYVKNQIFDKAALPKLAKIYPSGQIPFDPRGLGLRFWDDSRGMDPGRVLMSEQMDSIASHTHNLLVKATPGGAHTVAGGTGALAAETSILGRNTVNPNDHMLIISGTSGAVDGPIRPFGTTETRVKSIAPAAIMRVK